MELESKKGEKNETTEGRDIHGHTAIIVLEPFHCPITNLISQKQIVKS